MQNCLLCRTLVTRISCQAVILVKQYESAKILKFKLISNVATL